MASQLKHMMADEKAAPKQYYKLIGQLKRPQDKRVVRGIIKQERHHLKLLKQIKRRGN